ncbi:MAG: hypothetical protein JWO12_2556 [Frankiales bacterium]|nr:hypothetical protein [Frankiales bacterium]
MKKLVTLLAAAAAGAISLTGAQAPAAPSHVMTIQTGIQTSAAVVPLAVHCRTGLRPIVAIATTGRPGTRVPFSVLINGKVARTGVLTANASGTYATSAEVVDNHRNSVNLVLVSHSAVYGVVAPACTKPVPTSGVAASAARGSASSYSLNHNSNGSVSRWNPCDGPIHVRVNAGKAPAGALADVTTALAALGKATGLSFVYDGATSFVPTHANSSSQPARLVIAWAPPGTGAGQSDYYGAGAVGEGGWRSSGSSSDGGTTWKWQIVQGFVVVDPSVSLASGFGTGITRGALLLHELGHVVGLNHTGDTSQVLYPTLRSATVGSYGAGDLTGLKAVGATNGCTTAS